jgi:hypothetical protein
MKAIIERLKEPSTFRGLTIISGIAGLNLAPDQAVAIGTAVMSILGLIEVFRKEKQTE